MEFWSIYLILAFIMFFGILFTREKNNKLHYFTKVMLLHFIGLIIAAICIPFIGALFGFTSILINSIVIATLFNLKSYKENK